MFDLNLDILTRMLFGGTSSRAKRMSEAEIVGLAAGFFVALGYIPQIVRVWRLRDAQEISLSFNLLSIAGTILWLAYGVVLGLVSVIFWNASNLILLILLLTVKLRYGMGNNGHGIKHLPPSPHDTGV